MIPHITIENRNDWSSIRFHNLESFYLGETRSREILTEELKDLDILINRAIVNQFLKRKERPIIKHNLVKVEYVNISKPKYHFRFKNSHVRFMLYAHELRFLAEALKAIR